MPREKYPTPPNERIRAFDIDALATLAQRGHDLVQRFIREGDLDRAQEFAIEAGGHLLDAQELLAGRVDWDNWLKVRVGISSETAQGYMRFAQTDGVE